MYDSYMGEGERLLTSKDKELILLTESPYEFAKSQDGKRPEIAAFLRIPQGWVVDGRDLPQWQMWQEKRVRIVPLRPLDDRSVNALEAELDLAKLRETYGQDLIVASVWADDQSLGVADWREGCLLPQDLTKSIHRLTEEAIKAELENKTDLASMKRLAMFAQLSPKEHDQVTIWREIFLDPYRTAP